ncbi:antibiotic biosynthesis monooxygenase family protein [Nocardia stercoris]|uniref:Antibiotic biosynthesis monooxygenase n=1 Tax=Nocardia stercoris TaxID=2483361 RepID=A0A3M2LED1_9NOCA|nr:antibiotic biosynthesis monooxygenase family protein [Nocardia stercoris]RMI34345.1 antibiotic biosynthesis monooxygenase [Nocardia stercoris]
MDSYSLGIWTVTPGREAEFVRAWREMAERTADGFPLGHATLLRDDDQPNVFISFGPWRSTAEIQRWRESVLFKYGAGTIRPLLQSFTPHTLTVAATVE